MNNNYQTGHVGWSPDFKSTPQLPRLRSLSPSDAAICSPSLEWHRGPSYDGEGTAGGDQWRDGDHLLVIVNLACGAKEVMSVTVNCEDGKAWMQYQCTGDETGRELSDIAWWADLAGKLPPENERGLATAPGKPEKHE